MILPNITKTAVNPYTLAINSGVSKNLRGLGISFSDISGLIKTVGDTSRMLQTASGSVSGSIIDIVPYQNAVFNQIIVPVSNVVNSADAGTISYQDLDAMLTVLLDAKERWLAFALGYAWPDARSKLRAQAGVNTLAPYWDDYESRIRTLMASAPYSYWSAVTGGTSPAVTGPVTYPGAAPGARYPTPEVTTAGFGGAVVPAVIGLGLLWFLSRKKR